MAIVHTFTWKVKSGRRQAFQAEIATVKTIIERLGARVRILDRQMGHNAPCILFIVESSDWKAFGELQEKMQTDPELLAFWSKAHVDNPNRPAEIADIALALLIKDAFAADRYPFNQSRGECPMILLTKGGESSLLCLT